MIYYGTKEVILSNLLHVTMYCSELIWLQRKRTSEESLHAYAYNSANDMTWHVTISKKLTIRPPICKPERKNIWHEPYVLKTTHMSMIKWCFLSSVILIRNYISHMLMHVIYVKMNKCNGINTHLIKSKTSTWIIKSCHRHCAPNGRKINSKAKYMTENNKRRATDISSYSKIRLRWIHVVNRKVINKHIIMLMASPTASCRSPANVRTKVSEHFLSSNTVLHKCADTSMHLNSHNQMQICGSFVGVRNLRLGLGYTSPSKTLPRACVFGHLAKAHTFPPASLRALPPSTPFLNFLPSAISWARSKCRQSCWTQRIQSWWPPVRSTRRLAMCAAAFEGVGSEQPLWDREVGLEEGWIDT